MARDRLTLRRFSPDESEGQEIAHGSGATG